MTHSDDALGRRTRMRDSKDALGRRTRMRDSRGRVVRVGVLQALGGMGEPSAFARRGDGVKSSHRDGPALRQRKLVVMMMLIILPHDDDANHPTAS
jgi:hypothetical protein